MLLNNEINLEENPRIKGTISYLNEMKQLLDAHGIPLLLINVPSINLFWKKIEEVKYIQVLKSFAQSNGIDFVDLAEEFAKSGNTNKLYMGPWDYHLSPKGHTVASEALQKAFRRIKLKKHTENN